MTRPPKTLALEHLADEPPEPTAVAATNGEVRGDVLELDDIE